MAWLTTDDLRGFVKNATPADEDFLQLATDLAMAKAREMCGPVTPVETVTERRVRGGNDELPLKARPVALTSVAGYFDGSALDVNDYDFDGEVLFRKDGGTISYDVAVTYTSGYNTVPAPIKALALAIGQQHLVTMRRFGANSTAPIGFLIPKAAREAARAYLLAEPFDG